jgi:hypothetical protein
MPSSDEIKQLALNLFSSFSAENPEAGRMLRRLIPDLRAYPYRLCDGGKLVLRAKFTLKLARLLPNIEALQGLEASLSARCASTFLIRRSVYSTASEPWNCAKRD